jgi:hypothetical protein
VQPPPHNYTIDPFSNARGGVFLLVALSMRASMRLVTYVVHRIVGPDRYDITAEEFESLRRVDLILLGIENLLTIVAMIAFLVWIYRVLAAFRRSGVTSSMSPGLAVGGWFIPFANAVLPWLSVRSALRAVGASSVIAGVWWLIWLANTSIGSMHQLGRQLSAMPELYDVIPPEMLGRIFDGLDSTYWPWFLLDTAAFGVLAGIVAIVRGRLRSTLPRA